MTAYPPVLEHHEGRLTRWLRENRLRVAVLVAAVETVLVLTDVIGWFWVLATALLVFAAYYVVRRATQSPLLRQAASTAALSQVIPLLLPLLLGVVALTVTVVTVVLVIVLIVVALAAFAALVRRR
jgi:hypothetical protein